MAALVDLADWRIMVQLPHLVLVSFSCEQGKLYRSQVDRFVRALTYTGRGRPGGLPGQILDDALRNSAAVVPELMDLSPPAVVTGTRQALNASRRALGDDAFAELVSALLQLHGVVRSATPRRTRFAAWLRRDARKRAFDSVRGLLQEALDETGARSPAS